MINSVNISSGVSKLMSFFYFFCCFNDNLGLFCSKSEYISLTFRSHSENEQTNKKVFACRMAFYVVYFASYLFTRFTTLNALTNGRNNRIIELALLYGVYCFGNCSF